MNPSETNIALFEQYGHLSELKRILEEHKDLTTAFASDYIVRPDIIIAREPIEDYQLNEHDELVAMRRRGAQDMLRSVPQTRSRRSCTHQSLASTRCGATGHRTRGPRL